MEREGVRVVGGGAGCISAVTRCFWGKPKQDLTRYRSGERDTIEFEDLVTAEKRAKASKARKQLVTEEERELVMTGNFDLLVEEQKRKDEERDAELRRQEEKLRREEEAYYAAKREAAKRARQVSPLPLQQPPNQPDVVINHQPRSSSRPHPPTTPTNQPAGLSQLLSSSPSQEEEDFDQFLESVKARQLSITSREQKAIVPSVEGRGREREEERKEREEEEEEIDFGYWEKAESVVPNKTNTVTLHTVTTHTLTPHTTLSPISSTPDMDLNLL